MTISRRKLIFDGILLGFGYSVLAACSGKPLTRFPYAYKETSKGSQSGEENPYMPAEFDMGRLEAPKSTEAIKSIGSRIGNREIGYAEARDLIFPIIELYVESTRHPSSPEELGRQFYVARGNFSYGRDAESAPLEELHDVGGVKQLLRDYPKSGISDETIRKIVKSFGQRSFASGAAAFVSEEGDVFIDLNSANTVSGSQWYSIKPVTSCSPATPFTVFRHTVLHETSHKDAKDTEVVPKPVYDAFTTVWRNGMFGSLPIEYIPVEQSGLQIRARIDGCQECRLERFPMLEEFKADYVSSKINADNNLPYQGAYTKPRDLINLEAVLKSSGVSSHNLIKFGREGDLEHLLLRLGRAAGNRLSDDEARILGVGISNMIGHGFQPYWENVKEYFPSVDVRPYSYSVPPIGGEDVIAGCEF